MIVLAALTALPVGGCQTEEQRRIIGGWERFQPPQGLFPDLVDQKTYASGKVSYYFVSAKEKMVADPALMFRVVAYFEWLINEMRTDNKLTTQQLISLVEARNQIRTMIAMPADVSSADATAQFYSLSKFMALARKDGGGTESPAGEVDRRRLLLSSAQDLIRRAIEETQRLQPTAQTATGQGGKP